MTCFFILGLYTNGFRKKHPHDNDLGSCFCDVNNILLVIYLGHASFAFVVEIQVAEIGIEMITSGRPVAKRLSAFTDRI